MILFAINVLLDSFTNKINKNAVRQRNHQKAFYKKQAYLTKLSYTSAVLHPWLRSPINTLIKPSLSKEICKKGQKEDKSKFVTKSVGIIVTIIFM